MTDAQAQAILKGFHDELEKDAGFGKGLLGVAKLWGRALTGSGGSKAVAPIRDAGGKVIGRGIGPRQQLSRSELASQAWKGTKGLIAKNPYASTATAGGVGLGTGYVAS